MFSRLGFQNSFTQKYFIKAIFWVVVLTAIAGYLTTRVLLPGREALTLLLLALLCMFPFLRGLFSGRLDLFEPIYMLAFTVFLAFVLGPILMIQRGFVGVKLEGIGLRSELPMVTIIAFVGLAGYYAGYGLIGRRLLLRRPHVPVGDVEHEIDDSTIFRLIILIILVSTALFILWFRLSRVPLTSLNVFLDDVNYTTATKTASNSIYYLWVFRRSWPLLILLAWSFAPNKPAKTLVIALWLANFTVYFMGANRGTLFSLLGATLIYFYLRRRKRPSSVVLAVTFVLLVLASGFLISARNVGGGKTLAESTAASAEEIMDRGAATGTMIVSRVFPNNQEFLGPLVWDDLIYTPIPRVLWPDKPTTKEFNIASTALEYLPSYHAPGILGIYYAGFSLFGPFLILLFLGIISAYIYRRWRSNPDSPVAQVILAGWIPLLWIIFHRGQASFFVVYVLYYIGPVLLTWYLGLRISRKVAKNRSNKLHLEVRR